MIRRVTLPTRKTDRTREQVIRRWLDVHARRARPVPGLLRHVQSRIVEEHRRPDVPTPRPRWPRSAPTERGSA